MHALSLLAEDDEDMEESETDWEIANDYMDSDSDEEYVPDDYQPGPSHPTQRDMAHSSPPSKRLRLDLTPEVPTFDFRTSRAASNHAICQKWVLSFCQVLPGLEETARQYLKTEVRARPT